MTQFPVTLVKVLGAVLFIACVSALIWSLTRPALTTGPMPPEPPPALSAQ